MRLIQAVIKPFKLEPVKEALSALGVDGMTIIECKGFGRQKGHTELYRGTEYTVDFVPKLELLVAVREDLADATVRAIVEAARTGKIGDGKVFIFPIEQTLRIRTGEEGEIAL